MVGPLRIGIPLFNIYLNEADELSRHLSTELAEWAMELHRPVGEVPIALAHSLAGSSATVGFADLSHLARALEHGLTRSHALRHGTAEEAQLFTEVADDIRRLLHQFAAGFLKEPAAGLLERLAEHEVSSAQRLDAQSAEDESQASAEEAAADSEIGGRRAFIVISGTRRRRRRLGPAAGSSGSRRIGARIVDEAVAAAVVHEPVEATPDVAPSVHDADDGESSRGREPSRTRGGIGRPGPRQRLHRAG